MKTEEKKAAIEYKEKLQEAAANAIAGRFDFKEYYGLSDGNLESIYGIGHEMYKHKQYEKAKGVFALLSLLEPKSQKYMSACGSACFMLKDYSAAAQYFRMAIIIGDVTPKMLMRIAECTIRLDQVDDTKRYLSELIRVASKKEFLGDKESQSCKVKAEMMLGVIKSAEEKEKKEAAEKSKAVGQSNSKK
ncbi:MAG: tetratricopeptide repeat protein [Puniceicoccales bacterium]|jgi:TolA-binding protein|nr:tetratricopeptide repeat protein [Puniceicoccales bacterium]